MAKQKRNNVITHGLSGKFGDILVFSQRGGKTVVSQVPQKTKKRTKKQEAQQKHFQKAVFYAKNVKGTEIGQMYEDKAAKIPGVSGLNIAIADFMHAPDIEVVNMSKYKGKVGDEIEVEATDDFAVKSVHVEISGADGSIIEEGNAVINISGVWIYTAIADNTTLEGTKIVITASDLPGNLTTEEVNL
jgi:hypothetical protein